MDDPYLAGIDLLSTLGSGQDERRNRAAEIAPDFVHLAVSVTYGEILGRPGLKLRTRLVASIASLVAAAGPVASLRELVTAALGVGWTRQEIVETIIQTAAHAGISRAIEALADCHDLLAEMDPCGQSCEGGISETGQA